MDNKKNLVYSQLKKVTIHLKKQKEIVSAYLYGSILSDHFNSQKSDVDILLIVNDIDSPNIFIDKIHKIINANSQKIRLDINLVFMSEFLHRWHIYRPPSYFVGIKHRSKLLWGKNLLAEINDEEVTPEAVYKRIVDLAQSSRGIYLNSKEPEFWINKYTSWLKVASLEVLFLTGEFDLSFIDGLEKLKKKYSNIDFLNCLTKDSLTIKELNYVAENLRLLIYNNFIKK